MADTIKIPVLATFADATTAPGVVDGVLEGDQVIVMKGGELVGSLLAEQVDTGSDVSGADTLSMISGPRTATSISSSLPGGVIGAAYTGEVSVEGDPAATFAITSGALPDGLTMASDGAITGTPTADGTFQFGVTATSNGNTISRELAIVASVSTTAQAFQIVPVGEYATADGANTGVGWYDASSALGDMAICVVYSPGSGTPGDLGVLVQRASDVSGTGAETVTGIPSAVGEVSGYIRAGAKMCVRVTITPTGGASTTIAAAVLAYTTPGDA